MRWSRGVVLVTVLTLVGALPVAGGPSPAHADQAHLPAACSGPAKQAEKFQAQLDGTRLRFDGQTVTLTPSGLRSLPSRNATWLLWFHSLAWLVEPSRSSPEETLSIIATYTSALPDPGPSSPTEVRQATGWTEGAIRRRLETLTCLVKMTRDSRLLPVINALGDALTADERYPGSPLFTATNHAAQSILLLSRLAATYDRPDWAAVAARRAVADLPTIFSACGMSREQSSGYHDLNVRLWSAIARKVGLSVDLPFESALHALARPDGIVEPIGDGKAGVRPEPGGRLWCPATGWAANTRAGMHYILRFGPPQDGHGHRDLGAMTWFTHGVAVLSDRGIPRKTREAELRWAQGPLAHSVLHAPGLGSAATMRAARTGPDSYRLTADQPFDQVRTVEFTTDRLTVNDVAASGESRTWVQHWQLAPGWSPRAPTTSGVVAVHDSGVRIRLSCRDSQRRIAPNAVRVHAFADSAPDIPAWDVQCAASGRRVQLTMTATVIG